MSIVTAFWLYWMVYVGVPKLLNPCTVHGNASKSRAATTKLMAGLTAMLTVLLRVFESGPFVAVMANTPAPLLFGLPVIRPAVGPGPASMVSPAGNVPAKVQRE